MAAIFQNQKMIFHRVLNVEQCMKSANDKLKAIMELLEKNGPNNPTLNHIWSFERIANEAELSAFEVKVMDAVFKAEIVAKFVTKVGQKPNTSRSRMDCALVLNNLMFDPTFWTQTAWTGGRSATVEKFAFCKHDIFIKFFNQLLVALTGSIFTDDEMKTFIQSRSRNSNYERTTNRVPATRVRSKQT